jgi:DHA1 family bicyclomycin/chloramphenicol resistance-like MFS transporter
MYSLFRDAIGQEGFLMNLLKNRYLSGFGESVALMALMMSLTAMSIDAILPALPEIGQDLSVQRPNDNQLIVSLLIFGMAVGQMVYGPLSDSLGRKSTIYIGFGIYIAGCLLSLTAPLFSIMLAGRIFQGLGAAGPRIVTMAIVRDQYEGRAMARVMSFVMTVFILVPVIAPSFGQAILLVASWHAIFIAFIALALIAVTWFAIRQPETLAPARRIRFSPRRIIKGVREVCSIRVSFGYSIAAGFVFGSFIGYLNSAQQIFQGLYGLGVQFPLFFGLTAFSIGSALLLNARLVMKFGMRLLTRRALTGISILSSFYFAIAWISNGSPPFWSLIVYLMVTFFGFGILFGNLNAIAMEPLGHIAGVGAAVVGSLSTLISVPISILIGQCYNETVIPLIGGFSILSIISFFTIRLTENWKPTTLYE